MLSASLNFSILDININSNIYIVVPKINCKPEELTNDIQIYDTRTEIALTPIITLSALNCEP